MTRKNALRYVFGLGMTVAGIASAGVAPVDMTTVSTEIVPYIATAGGAGLLIYIGIKAIRVCVKAFNASAK